MIINGYPSTDADNLTFTDQNDLTHVTIFDANGTVLQEVPPNPNGRKVTAIRMAIDAPGFPDSVPAATPVS